MPRPARYPRPGGPVGGHEERGVGLVLGRRRGTGGRVTELSHQSRPCSAGLTSGHALLQDGWDQGLQHASGPDHPPPRPEAPVRGSHGGVGIMGEALGIIAAAQDVGHRIELRLRPRAPRAHHDVGPGAPVVHGGWALRCAGGAPHLAGRGAHRRVAWTVLEHTEGGREVNGPCRGPATLPGATAHRSAVLTRATQAMRSSTEVGAGRRAITCASSH